MDSSPQVGNQINDPPRKRRKKRGASLVASLELRNEEILIKSPTLSPTDKSGQAVSRYGESLLANSYMQCSLGDWKPLAALSLEFLEHSPDRAELALLAACAHLKLNDELTARHYLSAAQRWKCPPHLIVRALSSTVEDTMASYYRAKGDLDKEKLYLKSMAQACRCSSADLVANMRAALAQAPCNTPIIPFPKSENSRKPLENIKPAPPLHLGASKYDLSHLEQFDDQYVLGPIQDDEALFLYGLIRGMRISTILELGGLEGYSAKNFLKALGPDGTLFTCDLHPVAAQSHNHRIIIKDCAQICTADLLDMPIELIFFDCHEYEAQMACFHALKSQNLLNDTTILALHDTNTHPQRHVDWAYQVQGGFIHQAVERRMVNDFVNLGYHAFCLHTQNNKHSAAFPFRHGITIMQKFSSLVI